jgi:DNA-binding XRE family transcriptional regulator
MEAQKNEGAKLADTSEPKVEERAPIDHDEKKKEAKLGSSHARAKKVKNNVRKLRMERMMSKAELARRAGVSTLTVDRVERGMSCRMDTKRKILEALGLKPQDRVMVFGDAEED